MIAKFQIPILCLLLLIACSRPEVTADELVVKNRITYQVGSEKPFTGQSLKYYANGRLENRTDYRDGKKNGLSEWFWENGNLGQRVFLKDGKKNGLLEAFDENGDLSYRANYKDGVRVD